MRGYQRVELIGNLGADPEVREFEDGGKVANFSIAVNESWKDKSGQKHEHVEWFRVSVRGGLVGVVEQYLHVGDGVFVAGYQRTHRYTDKDGVDRWATEVVARDLVMLSSGGSREVSGATEPGSERAPEKVVSDDDLPF